jgi:hypothetical protein
MSKIEVDDLAAVLIILLAVLANLAMLQTVLPTWTKLFVLGATVATVALTFLAYRLIGQYQGPH